MSVELRSGNMRFQVPDEVVEAAKQMLKSEDELLEHYAATAIYDPNTWVSDPTSFKVHARVTPTWTPSIKKGETRTTGPMRVTQKTSEGLTVQPGITIEEAMRLMREGK